MFAVACLHLFTTVAVVSTAISAAFAGSIRCTKTKTTYQGLELVSSSQPGVTLGFSGEQDADGSAYLQEDDDSIGIQLGVYECHSSYMGYKSDTNGVYRISNGQIRVIGGNDETHWCLTVSTNEGGPITLQPCSTTDDESQTQQFWHVEQDIFTEEPASIRFLGNVTFDHGSNVGFYNFDVAQLNEATIINTEFAYDTFNGYLVKLIPNDLS